MSGLTLGWEYLTGYAVATDPASYERAEWPPHPARVFMALAAAWFETDEDSEAGNALRWLEEQDEPELVLPTDNEVHRRDNRTFYVPVNDAQPADLDRNNQYRSIVETDGTDINEDSVKEWTDEIDKKAKNAIAIPAACRIELLRRAEREFEGSSNNEVAELLEKQRYKIRAVNWKDVAFESLDTLPKFRNRQARTFPRVHVGNAPCFLYWPNVEISEQCADALNILCQKVTRIGHSSSLVRMWAATGKNNHQTHGTRFVVDETLARFHVRRISPGFLDTLVDNYGEEPRQRKRLLENRIAGLQQEGKIINGRGARERENKLKAEIKEKEAERDALSAPAPVRPKVGLWSSYREVAPAVPTVRHSYFDTDCLVLVRDAGPELPLTSTLSVTDALRGAVMHQSGTQPVPQWVSGHEPDGKPSASDTGHLACIPLPFVGHEHADGHLLGVGLVFPRNVDRRERGEVLGPLLVDETGQPAGVTLRLGRIGTWKVRKSSWEEQRHSLQPEYWTAAPSGIQTWASATPVVLDRFPKSNRSTDHRAWRREVADIIELACERIGLPRPEWVDISTTSWLLGSPRAFAKTRRLRGRSKSSHHQATRLGDGFPPYALKNGNAAKPQVHVRLHFAEPVLGPVLIGAGRFRGYGLCKPCKEIKS